MKNIIKYCVECGKQSTHLKTINQTIGERLILALFTFGFNELCVENNYECTVCGRIS